jgi:hypothetical protein
VNKLISIENLPHGLEKIVDTSRLRGKQHVFLIDSEAVRLTNLSHAGCLYPYELHVYELGIGGVYATVEVHAFD